jgi:feruloyl esterase
VTAVAGKELAAAFYGRTLRKSYFTGCSNGGRQALMEVQRYPGDFDGIIAGDPATGTPMQMGRGVVFQKMLGSTEAYLPQAKVELLSRATLAACDAADGLKDGLVSDPTRCQFKLEALKCASGDRPDCLNAKQFQVVQQIYKGYTLPNGETYAHGFPFGHEGGASGWQAWINGSVPPTRQADGTLAFTEKLPSGYGLSDFNFQRLSTDEDDPTFSWRTFDLARDLPRLKVMTAILSPLDPDLRPFKARGGKLLLYHGWSDPAISALGTVDYFNKVTAVVGSREEVDAFARLYPVPGMHHCSGGPGPNEFDMLTALEDWAEKGQTPAAIVATHRTDGKVDRTRPLCPYPQVARYNGSGSIDDAANFTCR